MQILLASFPQISRHQRFLLFPVSVNNKSHISACIFYKKFVIEEPLQVDSSVQTLLEGSSLQKMIEDVQKEKAAYLAAKEAKKAAEAARLAALKQ